MESVPDPKISATASSGDKKPTPRRRKVKRCCGLYSPMIPRTNDHPRSEAVGGRNGQALPAMLEARGVCYAFATSTKIHGVKNIYRAQGQ